MARTIERPEQDADAHGDDTSTDNTDRGWVFGPYGDDEQVKYGFSQTDEDDPQQDPDEMLNLATGVYDGLSDEEIEQVENAALEGRPWRTDDGASEG